jgi:DNA-binding transcriptional ArsR family regulator
MGDRGPGSRREVSSIRATAHPVRLQILSLLTGAELSAAEIARELGISHANASYHVRYLADAGLLEESAEEKIRGGIAKRYRHPWDAAPRGGSQEDAEAYVQVLAAELVRRFRERADTGRNYSADAEMWVAVDVWDRVLTLLEEAGRLVHAEARPPRSPGTVHVNLTAAAFEMVER